MYSHREDSELLAECIKEVIKEKEPKNFLDMGCGTGIQSRVAIQAGIPQDKTLAVDINKRAVKETRKLSIKAINSDLFGKVKGKFDLIAFNPPLLART